MSVTLLPGDCVEQMKALGENSVDAIVTDPLSPYGINCMGKAWDGKAIEEAASAPRDLKGATRLTGSPDGPRHEIERTGSGFANRAGEAGAYDFSAKGNVAFQCWTEDWAREAFRVLKPGGHMLVFGGTRTYHRMASAIEDAGFEIRDCLAWMYGSGFPKSLDVSKAIDKGAGAEREVVETIPDRWAGKGQVLGRASQEERAEAYITTPATEDAATWQGWGTALKPAFEPVVVARKPLIGTVSANVLHYGTGALNIDGCRIGYENAEDKRRVKEWPRPNVPGYFAGFETTSGAGSTGDASFSSAGRWPANVVLDEEAAAMLDEQTGELTTHAGAYRKDVPTAGMYGAARRSGDVVSAGDTGGASRFFYCAKVSAAERNAGLAGFEPRGRTDDGYGSIQTPKLDRATPRENWTPHEVRNIHPTVKPIALMRWLVRLVTPPGGTVLDPFLGSGTTGCAAALEGFDFIGCEREPDYLPIAEARIAFWAEHGEDGLVIVKTQEAAEAGRAEIAAAGQLDLFAYDEGET